MIGITMLKSIIVLLISSPLLCAADWPIFRGSAAQEGVRTDKAPKKLDEVWRYETKNAIEGTPAITSARNRMAPASRLASPYSET